MITGLLILGFFALVLLVTGVLALLEEHKRRVEESHNHRAFMEGLAYGAGLDERDRREALRRRLRLDE